MTTYAFEKVVCPKCGKGYAVPKGATATFKCPGRNCQTLIKGALAESLPKDGGTKTQA